MHRFLLLIGLFTLWMSASSAPAAAGTHAWTEFRAEVDRAVDTGNTEALQSLLPTLEGLDGASAGWPDYWAAYLHYRMALLSGMSDDAEPSLEHCIEHAGSAAGLEESDDDILRAEAMALLGTCHSAMAGKGPAAGMQHGPRASMLRDESLLIAPDNPRALLLAGAQDVWTPVQWGGSPERAERRLNRALERLDAETASSAWRPRWGRSDAIGHLAMALHRLDRDEEARRLLEQARSDGRWNGWLERVENDIDSDRTRGAARSPAL
jgi:hypothetical protein